MQTSKIYLINNQPSTYICGDGYYYAFKAKLHVHLHKLESIFTDFKRINENTILIFSKLEIDKILDLIRTTGETSFLILEFDPTVNKYTGLLSKEKWDWIQLKTFQIKEELENIPQINKVAS
jgi:hypothetical protein